MNHDSDYFRRRAAEARAAACAKDQPERVEVAGELALAYAALARRRAAAALIAEERPAIPLDEPA
jgi:pyridoxine/pyridoxamine 5'-phosphate oxidase